DHEPADLLLDVGVAVRVAQHRVVPVHPVDPLGDHVEVLGRVQRDGDPAHRTHRLGPLASAIDHYLGFNATPFGMNAFDGLTVGDDAGHRSPLGDGDALVAGAAGQRGGQVGGVGPAVARQPDRAGQVVGAQDRVALGRLGRGDQLAVEL